jgi:hypothetical protein
MFRIIVRNKHTLVYIRPLGKNIGKIFNTWKFDLNKKNWKSLTYFPHPDQI